MHPLIFRYRGDWGGLTHLYLYYNEVKLVCLLGVISVTTEQISKVMAPK